jgi:hypothetical protein
MAACIVGIAAGLDCYMGVLLKERLRYDDSLDAFGVHGVGGTVGVLLLGVMASKTWNAGGADGLLTGSTAFMSSQLVAVGVSIVYVVVVTYGLAKLVQVLVGLRVDAARSRSCRGLPRIMSAPGSTLCQRKLRAPVRRVRPFGSSRLPPRGERRSCRHQCVPSSRRSGSRPRPRWSACPERPPRP